eukprot:scaffold290507_cov27-Tisochrysis_lutea.AAC.3
MIRRQHIHARDIREWRTLCGACPQLPPQHTVAIGGHALLLRGIKVGCAGIVLVGGREADVSLREADEGAAGTLL